MSVKSAHPEYEGMLDKWKRCIDVCKGQDAIYAGGTTYLPRLYEQAQNEYEAYLKRTTFYNATWRTLVGLQGMIFRKAPIVQVPERIKPMLENITLSGVPLQIFALNATEECLKLGRCGLFVDYPNVSADMTQADAKRMNFQPSMKMYKAPSIINWKTLTTENRTVLSMVVLKECIDVPVDEFESKEVEQYRVLDLIRVAGQIEPIYRVRVFQVQLDKSGKEIDVLTQGPFYPMVAGQHLHELPFYFLGVDDLSWEVDEPPLIDLVNLNLAHFKVSADYEHGCHFTGLPTPVISGFTPDSSDGSSVSFCIGSTNAWVFPNPNAKASYLEFTGQGLNALEKNLQGKEAQMAILGARMLETQSTGVESANTVAIRRGGEQSTLASVAHTVSKGISRGLQMVCKFAGVEPGEDFKFELNRDFFPVPMDALTLTAIIAGWQNGAYSYETMFENLKKGEIVAVEKTVEEERQEIADNPPPVPDAKIATTPGNVQKNGPKPANTPATLAPTITQLQDGK